MNLDEIEARANAATPGPWRALTVRGIAGVSAPEHVGCYRRGAEAMREACAECVKRLSHEDGLGMGSQRIEGAIRALPIPEE